MDPELERYLNERGLDGRGLTLAGCEYEEGVLRFPRYSIDDGALLGWKCRDLSTGRFWGRPSGIPHAATRPLHISPNADSSIHSSGAMICEGESDTMRLASTDLPGLYSADVICIPGANAFPPEWVPLLRRYERVTVFADADTAGSQLPNKMAGLVPGLRCVRLPAGDDVCSFLLHHTESDLSKLYNIAPLHIAPPAALRNQNFVWDDAASRDHRDKLTRIIAETVDLKRRGNEFIGLCPFHDEKTASFSVNPTKGLYRCFGCEAKGDVVTFLRSTHGFTFGEAMQFLERYN